MPDAEIKALAENLGLKKIDLGKKDELVYRILDCQAEAGAATRAAKAAKEDADKIPKSVAARKKNLPQPLRSKLLKRLNLWPRLSSRLNP